MSHSDFQPFIEEPDAERGTSERSAAVFDFGWLSVGQVGRGPVTWPMTFAEAEPELKQAWDVHQASQSAPLPWESARASARDAWERVQAALLDGSQPKSSAR